MKKNRRRQRGIVLLVVLSLLTLFTLLMVTFIIVAGQYRQGALSAARVSRVNASPARLLDNATYAFLRDSTDPKNMIRFHSLLFDMYGGDGFEGSVTYVSDVTDAAGNPPDGTGGNFFDLRIALPASDMAGNTLPVAFDGYFKGCSLIITASDVAQGRTFRVVDYRASDRMFRVMPITLPSEHSTIRPNVNDRVVVNGQPFNGTGFGYNPSPSPGSPQLNPAFALQPNQFGQTNPDFVLGDADESYDAVDFQNMALAGIIPTSTSIAPDGIVVVPSFHRPELVNYWFATDQTKLPRAIMRPMPWDHPNFDGSNRELTLPVGYTPTQRDQFLSKLAGVDPSLPTRRINPWDVDNDGDRVPDSIWVDLGFPVQTMADGKQVKPLFAFLCSDLDGRINLNAAGSSGHINGLLARNATTTLARGAASSSLPRGASLGPPEINVGFTPTELTNLGLPANDWYPLFSNTNSSDHYFAMLSRRYAGRIPADAPPGVGGMDLLAYRKLFELPTNYFSGSTSNAYNSPPDLFGELAFGLDRRGQPTYDTPAAGRDLRSDSPYEFDVTGSQGRRADDPFTVAELERILRFKDARAGQLPSRVASLGSEPFTDSNGNGTWDVGEPYTDSNSNGQFDSAFLNPSKRRSVTTDSYDIPVPPVLPLAEPGLRTIFQTYFNSRRPLHVSDLLAARLLQVNPSISPAFVNAEVAKMLSWDLRAGTRMDVNRPFGNGLDDNGNGVVDEHGPTLAAQLEADPGVGEQIWSAGIFFDHNNDGNIGSDNYLARYHFAKHLFVLTMALKDRSVEIDFDGNPANNTPEETARGLAQWAINVVDFRDADSIMTPFEFDLRPFNGWNVDGRLGSSDDSHPDRELVWGCERPELLIKETLALHDRRTEDLRTDTSGTDTNDSTNPDDDFDQRLRPRGSLFIELYNPWTGASKPPAEFYSDGTAMRNGVVLNKRAPTAVGGPLNGAPVWRMIVVARESHQDPATGQPRDPDDPASQFNNGHVERGLYFVDPSALPPDPSWVGTGASGHGRQRHFPSGAVAELLPGRHCVVGPRGFADGAGNLATTIGRRTDAQDDGQTLTTTDLKLDQTRRIVLSPNVDPNVHQVQVLLNGLGEPPLTDIQPAIAVAMNLAFDTTTGTPRSLDLSLSEPLNGYPNARATSTWDPALASGEGAYLPALDEPLDDVNFGRDADIMNALDLDPESSPDDRNAHEANLRTVYLQRLANPLLPYDAATNPYRTIDQAPIDLTVFEGVHDPNDPNVSLPSPRTNAGVPCGSRQRGQMDAAASTGRKLWKSSEQLPPRPLPVADAHVFDYRVDHSLGFLNRTYGTRYTSADVASLPLPPQFVGGPNSESGVGHPFPWLNWNNRPFVSQYEMLFVPQARSSQLLAKFSVNTNEDIYKATTPPNPQPSQFGHLLNFFTTSYYDWGTGTPFTGPNLYRLFDYTHVPSRFMGTETWLDPGTFASGNGTELLHPPFNRIFSFREPGKVNINTIFEARVWDAIRGPNPTLPNYQALVDSRRGYGSAGDGTVALDPTVPTFFGNAFRATEAGDLVPVDSMIRAGVESTLLRSASIAASGTQSQKDGVFAVTGGGAHVDPDRNPYFRYQNMQRLDNLVTTHSNVYAIWVTMGMFEVTIQSDGSQRLGQEAGRETGSVERHRAFYIVDRSIPVAFQPGKNHNVDDAILLRRIIE